MGFRLRPGQRVRGIGSDFLFSVQSSQIAQLAAQERVPAIYENRAQILAGGLMSYGGDLRENFRQGAAYIDRTAELKKRAELKAQRMLQEVEKVDGEPRVASTLQWRSDARDEALTKIRSALEKAGISFLPESAHGVGLRGRHKDQRAPRSDDRRSSG
jgi:TPR repeat protein